MPTRWERVRDSEWTPFLASCFIAVAVVAYAFFPHGIYLCDEPDERGHQQCHTDQVYGFLPHETMRFLDAHQGFFFVLLTLALAWLGYRQWQTSDRQREIMGEQTRLAWEQFYVTNRPRLACRKVYYANQEGVDGIPLEVELADVGHGGAEIDVFAVAYWPVLLPERDAPPWRLKHALDNTLEQRPLAVPPNGSQVIRSVIAEPESILAFNLAEMIYAVGYVVYGNKNSAMRYRLGFIRRATRDDRVFRPVEGSDFEYSD